MFRPFPWEAHNAQALASALEGAFLGGLFVLSRRRLYGVPAALRASPYVVFAVVYAVLFAVAFSSFSNLGILARERVQMLPFLVVLWPSRPVPASPEVRSPCLQPCLCVPRRRKYPVDYVHPDAGWRRTLRSTIWARRGDAVGEDLESSDGLSRRTLIKRGAVVAGTMVWAAPLVSSFTSPAQAAPGSPSCDCSLSGTGTIGSKTYSYTCTLNTTVAGAQQRCDCDCCCAGAGAGCDQCNSTNPCANGTQFPADYCCTCTSGPCPPPFNGSSNGPGC